MRLLIPRSTLLYLLLGLIVVVLGVLAPSYLPERFFFDAIVIAEDFYNEKGFWRSYPVTMLFYDKTGLGSLPFELVAIIQLPILLWVIYKIGIPEQFAKLTVRNILAYSLMLMLAFFISMPSKEFITFLFIAWMPWLLIERRWSLRTTLVLIVLGLFFFGIWYRPYYVLIPIVAGVIYFITLINFKRKALTGICSGLLMVIFISLSYGMVKGEYLSQSTREALNEERLGEEATNSVIISPLDTETWYGEVYGILYGFASVNMPVNGLKHLFRPQIVLFVFWQLILSLYLLYLFKNCLSNKNAYRYELWAFYFVFAYFIIQGVFEPDLGSAVKHKIGILPFIYVALYYDSFRKNIPV